MRLITCIHKRSGASVGCALLLYTHTVDQWLRILLLYAHTVFYFDDSLDTFYIDTRNIALCSWRAVQGDVKCMLSHFVH